MCRKNTIDLSNRKEFLIWPRSHILHGWVDISWILLKHGEDNKAWWRTFSMAGKGAIKDEPLKFRTLFLGVEWSFYLRNERGNQEERLLLWNRMPFSLGIAAHNELQLIPWWWMILSAKAEQLFCFAITLSGHIDHIGQDSSPAGITVFR